MYVALISTFMAFCIYRCCVSSTFQNWWRIYMLCINMSVKCEWNICTEFTKINCLLFVKLFVFNDFLNCVVKNMNFCTRGSDAKCIENKIGEALIRYWAKTKNSNPYDWKEMLADWGNCVGRQPGKQSINHTMCLYRREYTYIIYLWICII